MIVSEPRRWAPEEVASGLLAGELVLVCAYENETGFRKFPIAGAIPLSELERRWPEADSSMEIVFYCRCPNDKTSLAMARRYLALGRENIGVLAGGVEAWLDSGFKLAQKT
jgi:rhodanese-related sulfurtransferase